MRWSLPLLFSLLLVSGCEPGRTDVREWKATDHDQDPNSPQQKPAPRARKEDRGERVWMGTCAACHGAQGRGDGPRAAEVKAPDLTRPGWAESQTDEQIAETIRKGKGQMPPNAGLKDDVMALLIQRIRKNAQ